MKKKINLCVVFIVVLTTFFSCQKEIINPETSDLNKEVITSDDGSLKTATNQTIKFYFDLSSQSYLGSNALKGAISIFNSKFGKSYAMYAVMSPWSHPVFDNLCTAAYYLQLHYSDNGTYKGVAGLVSDVEEPGQFGMTSNWHYSAVESEGRTATQIKSAFLHELTHVFGYHFECSAQNTSCVMNYTGVKNGSLSYCSTCVTKIKAAIK
jgi:hypothetical protein